MLIHNDCKIAICTNLNIFVFLCVCVCVLYWRKYTNDNSQSCQLSKALFHKASNLYLFFSYSFNSLSITVFRSLPLSLCSISLRAQIADGQWLVNWQSTLVNQTKSVTSFVFISSLHWSAEDERKQESIRERTGGIKVSTSNSHRDVTFGRTLILSLSLSLPILIKFASSWLIQNINMHVYWWWVRSGGESAVSRWKFKQTI